MNENINGILLLDKPVALTSNRALQRVKHLFKAKKAGHTGSLDPIATGMLPICFGEATKFSQFLLESDKKYYVTASLGIETSTGDSEGEVTKTKAVPMFTNERLQNVLQQFIGELSQVPPMFSAIKYKGKPLYELARQGIEVARQPRRIKIYSLMLEGCSTTELTLNVHCSKGTYIRTLVQDIGQALGCGAHVSALRRTAVSPYLNSTMYTLSALETIAEHIGRENLKSCLLPLESAVQQLPIVKLSTSAAFYVRMGQPVRAPFVLNSRLVRLIAEDNHFLGIGEVMPDGRVKPMRLVSQSEMTRSSIPINAGREELRAAVGTITD